MSTISSYNNQHSKISGQKKKNLNLMVAAVAMVALKQKLNVKKWSENEIIAFIKSNKTEIREELYILERNIKPEIDNKNTFRRK